MLRRSKGLRIISFCVFLAVIVVFSGYSDDAFKEMVSAIRHNAPKYILQKLQIQYANKRINGRGYVVSVTSTLEEDVVVNVSTGKDISPSSVNVVIFLRKNFAKRGLKLKNGQYVSFAGLFEEFRMNTIVVREGVVKRLSY
ncbi:MAG: hypothetical protein JSW40_01165 [Candidatus Omnitrophota bacterium]|nr:MAG: hypothetical protein JSW40_01165 [Candidatus Omnitrophota bacterium]